jgi:hypothetical protein
VELLLTIAGGILVLGIMFEVLWTAGAEGAGPLTKRIAHVQWLVLLRGYRRTGSHGLLVAGGVGVFMSALVFWVHGDRIVIDAATRLPADTSELIYFTGYTIFTLGTGDFIPEGDLWQVLTPIASLTGLFVVTFSISYLVSIIQALTHKRQVAVRVSAMGTSGPTILQQMCTPQDTRGLSQHLTSLTADLATVQQRLLSYPVLHYMHASRRSMAIAPAVAALDEALSIVEHGLRGSVDIDRGVYRPVRQVITELLRTLESAFIEPASEEPPLPDLEPLRRAGFATVEPGELRARMAELDARRRLLLGWVRCDGWEWEQVEPPEELAPPTRALAA